MILGSAIYKVSLDFKELSTSTFKANLEAFYKDNYKNSWIYMFAIF